MHRRIPRRGQGTPRGFAGQNKPIWAVLKGKCGEQDSNLRTVEDCDLNAAPLTKLGDPRVQNRRCAGLLSSHPSAYSEAKMASTKGGNVAP